MRRQLDSIASQGKIIIPDLLSLAGTLHHKEIKEKSINQIIKIEHKAISKAVIRRNFPKWKFFLLTKIFQNWINKNPFLLQNQRIC